jgi:uncharacterized protein (DUF362 family)
LEIKALFIYNIIEMKKMSRKKFIRTSFGALAGLLVFRNGIPGVFDIEDYILGSSTREVLVGMAGNRDNTSSLVRKAVELAGGLDFIKQGDSVLIKPNLNSGDPHPASTNPEVIYEVIRMVQGKRPSRIIVGDRSSFWTDTLSCMRQNGLYDAVRQTGAEVFPFEEDDWIDIRPEDAVHWRNGFKIPEIIKETDHIISIPVLKTHYIATFSMAIKNWVGIIAPKDRTMDLHLFNQKEPTFGNMLAEIHLARKPSFIVTDCTRAFVEEGPSEGKVAEPNIVYATSDIVANDIVGLSILKSLGTESRIQDASVWSHPQIRRAAELGLGIKNTENLRLKYSGIEDIDNIILGISDFPIRLFNWQMEGPHNKNF